MGQPNRLFQVGDQVRVIDDRFVTYGSTGRVVSSNGSGYGQLLNVAVEKPNGTVINGNFYPAELELLDKQASTLLEQTRDQLVEAFHEWLVTVLASVQLKAVDDFRAELVAAEQTLAV